METIPKSNCTAIGYFLKPHGVKGELNLNFETKYYDSLKAAKWYFVELDGSLVPFPAADEGVRIISDTSAIIKLNWVENQEYARRLSGKKVFLEKKDVLSDENQIGIDELTGFKIFEKTEGFLGVINQIDDYSGNIVFTVSNEGKEFLIPFNEDLLEKFDVRKKEIFLDLPEGLID